ncbi:MAG: hypothetical protein LBT62_02400 [Deltaproteobacteria bacterium]|nr:hypothetical protein [Deltaproteobacteria bacterium]
MTLAALRLLPHAVDSVESIKNPSAAPKAFWRAYERLSLRTLWRLQQITSRSLQVSEEIVPESSYLSRNPAFETTAYEYLFLRL